MRHRKASGLLPGLLDRTLPAPLEAAVWAHAHGCRHCARSLEELASAEALLRRLPISLVPRAPSREAELRLAGLARWAGRAPALWPEWVVPQAVGALAGALLVAALISIGDWKPAVSSRLVHQNLASVIPGDPGLTGWR